MVRVHLGLAALILIGGIVGGWWFSRSPQDTKSPVEVRNEIARSDAITVIFQRSGNAAGSPATITFIRGKGWIWDQPPGTTTPGATVISRQSETIAAASAGCYIAIPQLAPPVVPGVTVTNDLNAVAGLENDQDVYRYSLPEGGDEPGRVSVSEDLSTTVVGESYTATIRFDSDQPGAPAAANPGVYIVRKATAQDRERALQLFDEAHASPVATFTIEQRPVVPGQQPQYGNMQLVSPRDCPAAIVANPRVIPQSSLPSVFAQTNARAALGTIVQSFGGQLMLQSVRPVATPMDAPAETILEAIQAAGAQSLPLQPGATFATMTSRQQGAVATLMSVTACEPQAWFPC